ncbi:hypothetical protein [Streptomyces sp. 5-6(2022)]|uniref:hypothetical protein n=1 Tax=Streptomyces sp. 5-6(2022) TaxID=2936510 RepID=UPI0023B948A3|nr:hypothetical protein [Streptomyces sp. 5-6(2022)]
MFSPVPLCGQHRIEVALAVVPELLQQQWKASCRGEVSPVEKADADELSAWVRRDLPRDVVPSVRVIKKRYRVGQTRARAIRDDLKRGAA